MMKHIARFNLVCFLSMGLLLTLTQAKAEVTKEDKVKAAIVYNMIKHVQWPKKNKTLTLCIIGEGAINRELQKINRKFSEGRRLSVTHKTHSAPLDKLCELVYLHSVNNKTTEAVLQKLKNSDVLTISDREQFAQQGGIIGLYRTGKRIRFAINRSAAEGAKLSIGDQLLKLAKIIN